MQLTKNFSLHELTESQTATRKGIDNTPTTEVIANLTTLCVKVLQPVRDHFGSVHISSGYRCPKLNTLVGGSSTSQHKEGKASDLQVPGTSNIEVADWIIANLDFDQVIYEFIDAKKPATTGWCHVSFSEGKNRKQVLHIGCKNFPVK